MAISTSRSRPTDLKKVIGTLGLPLPLPVNQKLYFVGELAGPVVFPPTPADPVGPCPQGGNVHTPGRERATGDKGPALGTGHGHPCQGEQKAEGPFDGFVLCINHQAVVNQGDALFHLGR